MNHLSEEQLNEYMDHESNERGAIESHLSSCIQCATRLTVLQKLFTELEQLPEEMISQDISMTVIRRVSWPGVLPKWLTLTIILQAALIIITVAVAAPLLVGFAFESLPVWQMPSMSEAFIQLQSQWTVWLNKLSTFPMPVIPAISTPQFSSLLILFTVAGVFMLWLIGNGLLLRNQIK